MTWRRFTTLLRGLSPDSACVTRAQYRRMDEQRRANEVVVDGGPEQTTQVFKALFGSGAEG